MDWFLYDNGPCHERVNSIFDELKEIKHFKEITDFKSLKI